MKKYKICIIGDGLSGLITAQTLSKLDLEIDLISTKKHKKLVDNRTTAISPSNYKFISKLLSKKGSNFFFESKKINLYNEKENNNFYNFMNFSDSEKNLMLIFENKNLKKDLIKNIKKNKKIKIIPKNIDQINTNETYVCFDNKKKYYDMIFLCVGKNYRIVDRLLGKRYIKEDKDEIAFTCTVKHNIKSLDTRQYFLKQGPMAILPINKKKFSLIWSMNNNYRNHDKGEIRNLMHSKLKKIFSKKEKLFLSQVDSFPIYFRFNKNMYKKNVFAIGESVYNVYPIAGQGFNLVLRDINQLCKKLKRNISLGLQIKDSTIFEELSSERKPENFLYGLGINLTQNFFRYNKYTVRVKNNLLKDLDRFSFIKKIGLKIADKGIIN